VKNARNDDKELLQDKLQNAQKGKIENLLQQQSAH